MLFSQASVFLAIVSLGNALVSQPDFAAEGTRIRNYQAAQPAISERDDVPAGYYAPPYYPAPPGGWLTSK